MSKADKKTVTYGEIEPQRKALDTEREVLRYWDEKGIFERSVEERPGDNPFVFYEGPPTANGRPGVHHAMSRTIKDIVCRYRTMLGQRVVRKAGWDTHGLPVEIEVESKLGLDGKDQIEEYGIERFNRECRDSVFTYLDEWHEFTRRLGFWLDLDNPYVTCENNYIESVWWILKQFWDQDMLYEGHKIVPYCPRCGTSLSSHEVSQGYREVSDPSIYIKMKLVDQDVCFLVWTTTPWTLISNVALAVGPDFDYVRVKNRGDELILAEALLPVLEGEYEIIRRMKGRELAGERYQPVFPYFKDAEGGFRVIEADFVTLAEGTGIVHTAPAFGEEDYQIGQEKGLPFVQPVTPDGKFTDEVTEWAGEFIKDADPGIIRNLEQRNLLYNSSEITHSYPFCWRCDSPLVYYARKSWYIRTTAFKDLLIQANGRVEWFPPEIGENRFARWLEGNVDWALSRERYWGTPLNIWICDSCGDKYCLGTVEELRSLSGKMPEDLDLHRPFIDQLDVGCPECGGHMTRVPEVIDCWFDSGAMPFAQYHYPIENMDVFRKQYPAEFISEGVDQSRGWFYSLLVIGTFLTRQSPYRRCLPHGMILDAEGQKMSKSRGNAVFASDVLREYGADTLRCFLISSGAPYLPKRFDNKALKDVANKFMGTLRNLYSFFALYANLDGFAPSSGQGNGLNLIDRWIVSRFNTITGEIREDMEKYELTRAIRRIQNFVVDELSNWYLRRCRRRFWKNEMSDDKIAAYETFYRVLEGVSRLSAPFVPFLSEAIFLRLREGMNHSGEETSVHLQDFPAVDEDEIDRKLEENMQGVLGAVALGRAVRNKAGIKIRTPLKKMYIKSDDKKELNWIGEDEFSSLVLDELNVKEIEMMEDRGDYISYSVKPDYSVLGEKLGSGVKEAAGILAGLDRSQINSLLESGEITITIGGQEKTVRKDELKITRQSREGLEWEEEGSLTVVLDTRLTPDLVREGMARDLVNRIQNFRKESGLEVSDRIELSYRADDAVEEVFEEFGDYIGSETLTQNLVKGSRDWDNCTTFELDGSKVKLWIQRA